MIFIFSSCMMQQHLRCLYRPLMTMTILMIGLMMTKNCRYVTLLTSFCQAVIVYFRCFRYRMKSRNILFYTCLTCVWLDIYTWYLEHYSLTLYEPLLLSYFISLNFLTNRFSPHFIINVFQYISWFCSLQFMILYS